MNIGEAIEAMKQGQKVRRAGWIDRDRWAAYEPAGVATVAQFRAPPNRRYAAESGGKTDTIAFFTMKKPDGGIMYGWSPTQTDLDACDWYVVPLDGPDPHAGTYVKTPQGTAQIVFDRPKASPNRKFQAIVNAGMVIIIAMLMFNAGLYFQIWRDTDRLIDTLKACVKQ